jgi:aminopeptidase N
MNQVKSVYRKDYKKPDYKIDEVHLTFKIYEDKTIVYSSLSCRKNSENATCLTLHAEEFEVLSVQLDQREIPYLFDGQTLTITPDLEVFSLEIETRLDPGANTKLEGLYQSGGTFCTQCEAEGFRRIVPFLDRPDVLSVYTVRMEADQKKCPVLLSNGNLMEEGILSEGRHFAVWHDPFPKPCYLFALVAGDLVFLEDHFVTMSGRKVVLRIYVRKGDEEQTRFAMQALIHAMKWDEEVYGREYQLDRFNIVAVSDFNMGAMENTSLNIFNTALVLAHPATATDEDFRRVESVIAHEYFHNWSGNRVTCRDWFQLSLKEGLTVFRDQEFSADRTSKVVQRIEDVDFLRKVQFQEDAGSLSHPVRPDEYIEINNFYTTTIYEKGAELIRMLKELLGFTLYYKGTDLYFSRYDGQAVTCDDFVSCMEEVSQKDLSQFKLWYSQAGTPAVFAQGMYDPFQKRYELTLKQKTLPTPSQPDKKPLHIPVQMGLVAPNGEDLVTKLLELKTEKETFVFEDIAQKPVFSIFRGASAPVRVQSSLSSEDLCFLMVHDPDLFNRWEAGRMLALRLFHAMLEGKEESLPLFLDSFEKLVQQGFSAGEDLALLALRITLPDVTSIGLEKEEIDPIKIYKVYQKVRQSIQKKMGPLLKKLYFEQEDLEYKQDWKAMSRRSLRGAILYLLEDLSLAKELYEKALCMTDRVFALRTLAASEGEMKEEAFADFYCRFKQYPLVVDKWFFLQASAPSPGTFARVKALKDHRDFLLKNPNRARALLGGFSLANPVCFHAANGEGYRFLGEMIRQLDPINPQIAARLLTPFKDWRLYTKDRQEMMKEELKALLSLPQLSPNSLEIVTKSLAPLC